MALKIMDGACHQMLQSAAGEEVSSIDDSVPRFSPGQAEDDSVKSL